MSLDCEYNTPSRKTIQIGAAAFDAKTGQIIDQFETYVNPGEPISRYITEEVCGIMDHHVRGAPNIQEAYEMLREFHKKHKCFKNPLVWGSGTRNDSQALFEEAYPGTDQPNFMGYRVWDVKTIFQSIQMHHNKKISGTLKETCELLQIGFEGQEHTALADAINSARVWFVLMKLFPKGFK